MFAPKRILVPTDFSENADYALRQALELAQQYHAKVYLLHVAEPVAPYAVDYCPDAVAVMNAEESEIQWSKEMLHRELEKFSDIQGIEVITDVRKGDTVEEIIREQDENSVDLIVMPSHGKAGWMKRMMGQISEKVTQETHTPVLMVKH